MNLQNSEFNQAIKDYAYLINRHYPDKGCHKLVSDRYRLSGTERSILYRGVNTSRQIENHRDRILFNPSGLLIVDGYNVLFTLYNYRLGNPVFISTDNLCRDAGALFGKITNENLFHECIDTTITYLGKFSLNQLHLYLDASVSQCQTHTSRLRQLLSLQHFTAGVKITDSADRAILKHKQGVIASSDSEILDGSENPIFDLPGNLLKEQFNADLPDLSVYLK